MSAPLKLMPDVEGLARQVDPLSRRGFFLAASAATAAGYTLAAGPVRADAIHTDTAGLTVGDAKVKVSDGEMPVYYARPANAQSPPVILVAMEIFGLHEYIEDVVRRLGKLGALAVAPDYYFRKGGDLTKITDMPQLMPSASAAADERCGNTPPIIRTSRRPSRSMAPWSTRRHKNRSGRRAQPSCRPR
jgi:carboxymethylenebutenolidase